MMEKKRSDCPALPPGWKKEEVIRKSGLSAGKSDVYYYSPPTLWKRDPKKEKTVSNDPSGKKFRSKPQLSRYLGNKVDLGCFDFRTGKMMPGKLQKSKQRLRHDPLSLAKGGKPDLNTALPIRQTASIFKQPVTKVTSHPGNKVKADLQRASEQPRQLFWERRLKGLQSSDVTEEVLRTMDLPIGLQGVGPDSSGDTLLSAIASALHMSSTPITGQTAAAAEKNPAIWLNTSQPLCRAFTVTDEQIREQELKVHQARRSLEDALMADGLARAAENTREQLEGETA
ncbi:methyl-CpG-binding domain protein 2 isoform X2 [Cyclopterus lumpus]|uniref:methyl-CpG-binding domain protein 2 isoform X2 n=1 Tax=Cyclopterus lumpus TaxID=8103 RepID=UPI0014873730|nr:methyl-CpG-binding domain protein 2 isoform X2 [Cyclopterus lumpus]